MELKLPGMSQDGVENENTRARAQLGLGRNPVPTLRNLVCSGKFIIDQASAFISKKKMGTAPISQGCLMIRQGANCLGKSQGHRYH